MYKSILVFCVCLTHLLSADSLRIELYVNTNQCANCNLALGTLAHLHASIVKIVHLPESNRDVAEEMLEPFGHIQNLQLRFFSNAGTPFGNPLQKSFYRLFNNNRQVDSSELNLLISRYRQINALAQTTGTVPQLLQKIALPDSIKLSDRLNCFVKDGRMAIGDYLLNKSVVVELDAAQTKISKLLQIKASAFKPQAFLTWGLVDTAVYRRVYKDLQFLGKTKPQIDAACLADSSLHLLLSFPCGVVDPLKKDTGIAGKLFFYSKNLFTKKSRLLPIPEDLVPGYKEEYYIANMSGFNVVQNTVYFTLFQEFMQTQNKFLAEYTLGAKQLAFSKLLPYQVSDSAYFNTTFGNTQVFLTASNARFLYALYQPVIVRYADKHFFDLESVLQLKTKHQLQVYDVWENKAGQLLLLANKNTVDVLLVVDAKKGKLVEEKQLNLKSQQVDPENLKFLNANTLLGLDKAHKHLLVLQLD